MERRKNKYKKEKGQALVEMAIILPLVIALLCGTIEFGWLCFNQISISNLARQGARKAVVYSGGPPNLTSILAEINEEAPEQMRNGINVSISYSNFENPREGDAIVRIDYTAKAITPVLGIITAKNEYLLSASCVMKVE
ncbi:MAG: pilus assembly protein [Eubacteriales bacterium]|nr:pilus assembly protein [Eubacteriales bacterium]